MRKLTQLLSGFFLILVFVTSITFSYYNTTEVAIRFGNWVLPDQPIAVWIIGAFVSGGSLGLLLGLRLFQNLMSRSELRRLRRKLLDAEQEVAQLRKTTLTDLRSGGIESNDL